LNGLNPDQLLKAIRGGPGSAGLVAVAVAILLAHEVIDVELPAWTVVMLFSVGMLEFSLGTLYSLELGASEIKMNGRVLSTWRDVFGGLSTVLSALLIIGGAIVALWLGVAEDSESVVVERGSLPRHLGR
jgi:hypothetical protein